MNIISKNQRGTTGSDLIATVNYHSSFLRPWCQPTWTNTLPRHFCRGPASHKPFDFLPSIYPFYMFLAAKTFSASRRVRNHYTKRILNLILNRKKFLQRKNDPLDKQKPRRNCRAKDTKFKTPPRWRLSQLVAGRFGCIRFLSRIRLSELTGRRRAQKLRRKTRHSGRSKGERGGGANVRASGYGVFDEVPRGGAFGHRRTKPSELKITPASRGLSPTLSSRCRSARRGLRCPCGSRSRR